MMIKPYVPTQTWTIEGSTSCAASSYRWFRDVFCELEKAAGAASGISSYDMINNEIASVPPGANGVTYLSYLQGADGVRANPNCAGGFAGLRLGTTKAEMARAVMEGICYELKVVLGPPAQVRRDAQRHPPGRRRDPARPCGARCLPIFSKPPFWSPPPKKRPAWARRSLAALASAIFKDARGRFQAGLPHRPHLPAQPRKLRGLRCCLRALQQAVRCAQQRVLQRLSKGKREVKAR